MSRITAKDREEYPYIIAFGMSLGSYEYYIAGEVQKAREQGAPRTAYREHNDPNTGKQLGKGWKTIEECDHAPALDSMRVCMIRAELPHPELTAQINKL